MKREKERGVRGYTEWRGGGVRDGYVRHLHSLNFNNFQQAGTAHTHRPISNQSLLCFFFLGGEAVLHRRQQPDFHSAQNLSLTSFADPSPCLLARLQSTCPAAKERLWSPSSVQEEEGVEHSLVLGGKKNPLLAGWMCACGCLR